MLTWILLHLYCDQGAEVRAGAQGKADGQLQHQGGHREGPSFRGSGLSGLSGLQGYRQQGLHQLVVKAHAVDQPAGAPSGGVGDRLEDVGVLEGLLLLDDLVAERPLQLVGSRPYVRQRVRRRLWSLQVIILFAAGRRRGGLRRAASSGVISPQGLAE